jgi:hypothetical protein
MCFCFYLFFVSTSKTVCFTLQKNMFQLSPRYLPFPRLSQQTIAAMNRTNTFVLDLNLYICFLGEIVWRYSFTWLFVQFKIICLIQMSGNESFLLKAFNFVIDIFETLLRKSIWNMGNFIFFMQSIKARFPVRKTRWQANKRLRIAYIFLKHLF